MEQGLNIVNQSEKIRFITLLRGIAPLLIVWDHLVAGWTTYYNIPWVPLDLMRKYVTIPLAITQDFGFLGVAIFFLISGFIITHVAQRESRKEFAIKRILRIYPPLILSIFLILIIFTLYSQITGVQTYLQDLNPNSFDILLNISLLNYFVSPYPGKQINGVAWILAIEGLFYVLCFLILPYLKKKPKFSLSILIGFVAVTLIIYDKTGTYFDPLAINAAFLPYLILGQILYYRWKNRISTSWFIAFSAIAYFFTIEGLLITKPSYGNTYSISFAYAYLIFVIAILLGEKIKVGRILGFYSKISYSFLINNALGIILIAIPFSVLGYTESLVIGLILLTAISYFLWRYVEEPFRKFSKKILLKISKSEIKQIPTDSRR